LRGLGHLPDAKFVECFKRNPEEREGQVFGAATGNEERRARTLFRKPRAKAVPSDRFRLLSCEVEAAAKKKGERQPSPQKPGGPLE
ncbi:MAG: hypothetical protein ACXVI6_07355, partial [Candidatus Aminicenantales bacterium]